MLHDKIIAPINAIRSWEGYEYQGHIALFVVLSDLYELLRNKCDFSEKNLQIEGEEDFAIRNGEKYISLHQVKSGKIDLKENAKFAFVIEVLQNEADYGYFHVKKGNDIHHDFVDTTLKYIETLCLELNKDIKYKNEINGDTESDYIIIDNIALPHKRANIYDILKYKLDGKKDKKSVELAVDEIKKTLNTYKNKIETDLNKNNYSSQNEKTDTIYLDKFKPEYDAIRDIKEDCYKIIKEILRIVCPNWSFVDDKYLFYVYNHIFLAMKNKITEFDEKRKTDKCIITYDEFLDVIKFDYHKDIETVKYQYFKVIQTIEEMFEKYPQNDGENCIANVCTDCEKKNVCNLFLQIKEFNERTLDGKEDIIYKLLLKTPELGKLNNLPDDDLITFLLLQMLDEIENLKIKDNNIIQSTKNKETYYRLSLNNSRAVKRFQQDLESELKNNPDKSFLFQNDVLITANLNEEYLVFDGAKINVLDKSQLDDIRTITSDSLK